MAAFDVQIVIGCTDPSGLAEFWAEALAYVVEPPPAGFDSWAEFAERIGIPPKDRDRLAAVVDPERVRPRVLFQKAPETQESEEPRASGHRRRAWHAPGSEERK